MRTKGIWRIALMGALLFSISGTAYGHEEPTPERMSCTSITVGRKASADGSVMTSHTCDGNYRTWMDVVPARTLGADTTVIAEVYRGRMHTDHSTGARGMRLVGTVPQPGDSYRFLNTAYPCLNEKQLGIGETTIGGRQELRNPKGMFTIEELERLALQQCSTARQAIAFIGDLIKRYGYGDDGECITIADPKEVWQMEIFGEGPDSIGGVWAAVRIPDDEVGVLANISRISKIDTANKDYCMASDNVRDVALRMGLWDGKEPFRFWKAYSGCNYFNEPKNFSIREYFIFKKLAPDLKINYDDEELPFSIKPAHKVSLADMNELLAETYEGTEWDKTRNLLVERKDRKTGATDTIVSPYANPWMTRDMAALLNALKPDVVDNVRTVSVPQCSYSTVIQLRDWLPDAVGGVAWIALDNPGQSPRIPIFSGTTVLPDSYAVDGQLRYDENAAVWNFRRANKLATVKWDETRGDIEKARRHFVKKGVEEMPFVEKRYNEILAAEGQEAAEEFLTGYTADFAGAAGMKWKELGNKFWSKFARAF